MCSTLFVHNSLSLFCMSKPRNFLVTHFMEKMSYFLTKHYFCCLCSCSFFFFTASHFSSCWPLAFLIFSLLQLLNFHVILPAKFFFFYLFFISPTSSFCDIHVSVHIKMQWKKRLAYVFFHSKNVGGQACGKCDT